MDDSLVGMVDFHCHLDLYPDHAAAVEAAEAAGVFTLAVTTTPKAWLRNNELAKKTKYVRAALGLHPQLVSQRANELDILDLYFDETRYIGEVGLDAGPRFYKSLDLQKQVFKHVLQRSAKVGNKIISIHSVRSAKSVLDHIEAYLPATQGKVVLHWFTGTLAEARRAVEMGCYFSVNATMFDSDKSAKLISTLPLNRLLTETDGPFTVINEQPAKPEDVIVAVKKLAKLHGFQPIEMVSKIKTNLRDLLQC